METDIKTEGAQSVPPSDLDDAAQVLIAREEDLATERQGTIERIKLAIAVKNSEIARLEVQLALLGYKPPRKQRADTGVARPPKMAVAEKRKAVAK